MGAGIRLCVGAGISSSKRCGYRSGEIRRQVVSGPGRADNMESKIHRMQLPREIIVGYKSLELIFDIFQKLNFQSSLLITGEKTYKIAGKFIIDQLQKENIKIHKKIYPAIMSS